MRKREDDANAAFTLVCVFPVFLMFFASILFDCGTLSPVNDKTKLEAEIKELRAEIEKLKNPEKTGGR